MLLRPSRKLSEKRKTTLKYQIIIWYFSANKAQNSIQCDVCTKAEFKTKANSGKYIINNHQFVIIQCALLWILAYIYFYLSCLLQLDYLTGLFLQKVKSKEWQKHKKQTWHYWAQCILWQAVKVMTVISRKVCYCCYCYYDCNYTSSTALIHPSFSGLFVTCAYFPARTQKITHTCKYQAMW